MSRIIDCDYNHFNRSLENRFTERGHIGGLELRKLAGDGVEAILIRGIIKRILGHDCEMGDFRGEKSFMEFSLRLNNRIGSEMLVTDHYGSVGIIWGNTDLSLDERNELADIVYSEILHSEKQLDDYDDKCFHDGTGMTMYFGIENGDPYFYESNE